MNYEPRCLWPSTSMACILTCIIVRHDPCWHGREDWLSASVVNHFVVTYHIIRQSGFSIPCCTWSHSAELFPVRSRSISGKSSRRPATSAVCECGQQQTVNHVADVTINKISRQIAVTWWRCGIARWVSSNEVNLRRARLVLRWVTMSGFSCRCRTFISVCNQPPRPTQPSIPLGSVNENQLVVHSVSGWTRGVQVKLWDPLRMHAIPERLRGVFMMRRYTNPNLPYLTLPYLTWWCWRWYSQLAGNSNCSMCEIMSIHVLWE